jgi:DNA-binding transcriptional MerR regulator
MVRTSRKKLVKISELARMAGVSTPTIKHYMAEGLLPQPAMRTSRNMAYYEPALAERIRVIKALQTTHFFPLRVIAELLEPAPSAKLRTSIEAETRRRLGLMMPGLEAVVVGADQRSLTRAEVLKQLQISAEDLEQLEEWMLALPRSGEGGTPVYRGADLDLLEVIDETRRKGLGDVFPMEILPRYVDFLRRLVQDELELFRQRVLDAKLPDNISIEAVTREATHLGGRLVLAMRTRLILAELQGLLAQPDS